MKRTLALVFMCLLLSAFPVHAKDISLSASLEAKAYIKDSERYGRQEKSLIVTFPDKRMAISTNDGMLGVRAVMNHSAEPVLWQKVCEEMKTEQKVGGKVYLKKIKEALATELEINEGLIAQTGTAANMDNLAVITKEYDPYIVTALTTAGTKSNALRAGLDEGKYIKGEKPKGTINIIILTNARLTEGALANAVIVITEAKTAALQDLDVRSTYTPEAQATGTGTDTVMVVSGTEGEEVSYSGGHSKIGELIAKAVYESVVQALKKQNGYEPKKKSQDCSDG